LAALAFIAVILAPMSASSGPRPLADNLFLDGWVRWDAIGYLALAGEGYWHDAVSGVGSPALLPVYPLAIALLEPLVASAPLRALLVANVAFAAALLVIYRLVADRFGATVAVRSVLLLCVLPYAFLFSAAYPHSLALLFVALMFASGRRLACWPAAGFGCLAALTLPCGVPAWLALVAATLAGAPGRRFPFGALPALAAMPAALAAIGAYAVLAGDLPAPFVLGTFLGMDEVGLLGLGWNWMAENVLGKLWTPSVLLVGNALAGVAALLGALLVRRFLGLPYAVFVAASVVLGLALHPAELGSMLLLAFPLVVVAALYLRHELLETLSLSFLAIFLAALAGAFFSWHPITGSNEGVLTPDQPARLVAMYRAQGKLPQHPLALTVERDLLVLGYDLPGERYSPGEAIDLAVYLQQLKPTERRYLLSAHLLDRQGQRRGLAQKAFFDLAAPLPAAAEARQRHDLRLPLQPDLPPGVYSLELSILVVPMYSTVYERPLIQDEAGTTVSEVALQRLLILDPTDLVAEGALQAQHSLRASLAGELMLLGYDLPSFAARPGEDFGVTLYWGASAKPQHDYTVFVQALDASGSLVAQSDGYPLSGGFPTTEMEPGMALRDRHVLKVPSTFVGPLRLIVGMYRLETGQRLPVRMAGSNGVADYVDLGPLPE
jgi:hypothetical protein